MSIRILRGNDGSMNPIVICDWCGERITEARDGNFMWDREAGNDPGVSTEIRFAHKACTRAADRAGARRLGANELMTFVGALWRGLAMTDREVVEWIKFIRGSDGSFDE